MIGAFVLLCGLLFDKIKDKNPLHTMINSWLLPFASIWFTLETKLLANLGGGSPFHMSWPFKNLGPKYCSDLNIPGYWLVDLTFSLATLFMTAIGTSYAGLLLVKELPKTEWMTWVISGILQIALSAYWMIATTSGIPALVDGMTFPPVIPPFIPVKPTDSVAIHIRDIVIGIVFIATGMVLDHMREKSVKDTADGSKVQTLSDKKWTDITVMLGLILGWLLFLIPKIVLHLTGQRIAG